MRLRRNSLALTAVGLTAGLALTACGSDGGGSGGDDKALDGVSVTVGSKDFTENILLGKILVKALEAKGADVTDQTNLGGSAVNRKALTSGEITVSPEYNGTGWTVYLGHDDPGKDPKALYEKVAEEDLSKNQLKWVGSSPFNDTYGFAANGDLAKKEGGFDLQKMADYLKAHQDATLCLETEFPDRPDGLVLFEDATGYQVPQSQIKILDTGLVYTETAKGACQFGEVFTTDGRITALNLDLVEDPGVFILYNVSYVFRDETYSKNAQTYDALAEKILAPLDNKKMAELNAKVDVEGDSADKVAEDYVDELGIT
ncbi:glycine betaine ABC transporter substrate-binding protein [Phycicoccus sp.]|uniref:glycine betaine ABC transporter substrate-binding protein n=1 Tax=Phycicoccus sp. TaxID=1902410 RepID=UPI002D1FAA1F|nr:glycine betaine ABC transporter substrate-binding protein [Phycicoccus sp.]